MTTTRRAALGWLAGGMVAAGRSRAAAADAPYPIVDTHTHFYDPGRPEGVPWPPPNDQVLYQKTLPDRFVQLTKPLGVAATIVIEASPWLEDNQWVLDLAPANPVIVGVVGNLPAGTPEFRGHLDRFARNPLFRGIRLNGAAIREGVGRRAFVNDLERLAGAGLVLDALGDGKMLPALLLLADRVRQLRIVIDHLPFYGSGEGTLTQLGRTGNVYAKVSGVLRPDGTPEMYRRAVDALWTAFGPERLIYGSNWPVSDRIGTYQQVLDAVQPYFAARGSDAERAFFFDNSRRFYRWRGLRSRLG